MKSSYLKQTQKLSQYIANSHLTIDIFDAIKHDFATREIISSVLISVKDNTVIELTNELVVLGTGHQDRDIQVWDYTDWRDAEASLLTSDYDLGRFYRSTQLDILRHKTLEHSQYSFVTRRKESDGQYRVIKYTFVKLIPDAYGILGIREDVTHSIEHDIVTGGLNREGFLRELTIKLKNRQKSSKYTLLCFNIKNFRIINEIHGSEIGDKVLQTMYTSIVYSELHPLSYARYESDNFICLIQRHHLDTDTITRLCQQECITSVTRIPFRSLCGIYNLENEEISAFDACAHARLAISFIKDKFITPWIVFDPQMQQKAISDTEVLMQLEEAMKKNELVPYYQPVVNVRTGRIEMAEALVRWISPEQGIIPPGKFIPVLERNGGLPRIDKLMEQHVFSLQQRRLEAGLPTLPIDINLSWSDFTDPTLIDQLQKHILDPSVPTDLLRFEITESSYKEIAENSLDVLNFFQQHGVKLLVDDLGQGYAFGTMKNVDYCIVKLDKSLIDQIGLSTKASQMTRSMINVIHGMNAKVVAEGVEEVRQVEFLKDAGCDYIQGYYYYKPMDEQSFIELIEQQHAEHPIGIEEASEQQSNQPMVMVSPQMIETQNAKMFKLLDEARCMRMLLEELDIHYFEWDIRTHVDIAGDKFVKMYNLPSNTLADMPEVCPLCLPEDIDRFRAFYRRAERGEKMGSDCFRLYTPDGKGYTWYRKTFYTLFDQKDMPYKAIITMQDCQDEYRFRMLRTRDRMLTQQQEIVTFIYTLNNDTISITYCTPSGEVATGTMPQFLHTPTELMQPDQVVISNNIRKIIEEGLRTGYFDFPYVVANTEFRAHYSMVDGEYGHLYAIIGQAEDINKTRDRLNAKEQLLRMAEIDGLTQIYNRTTGEQKVSEMLKQHRPGAFGILDCDKFKQVNDTFGHVVGDELLKAIAKIMTEGNNETINMRLGGDEFAFFATDVISLDEARHAIQEFFQKVEALRIPCMADYTVSVSVGVVIYDGTTDSDFDSLYRTADLLLYESKKSVGNKLTIKR